MKKNVLFIIFCFSFLLCSAQKRNICNEWNKKFATLTTFNEQIKYCHKILPKVDDICKIEIYIEIATVYENDTKNDSSFYYYNKAIQLATKEKKLEFLADAYARKSGLLINIQKNDEAIVLLKKSKEILAKYPNSKRNIGYFTTMSFFSANNSNYEDAIKYNDSNIVIAKKHKLNNVIPDSYHNIGFYYFELSDYEKAAKNLILAAQLKEKEKESDIGNTYYILGCCYESWGYFEVSKKYFYKGIFHSKKQGNDFVSNLCYVRLSKSLRNLKQYKESEKCINESILLCNKNNYVKDYAEILTEKGWLYLQKNNDTKKAEQYFIEGYKLAVKSNDYGTIFFNLQSLLGFYYKTKEFKKATPYLKLFEKSANECQSVLHTKEKHAYLFKYYEGINDYKNAFTHFKTFHNLQDSLKNTTVKVQVADLEKKYDVKNKELTIVSLNKDKIQQKSLVEKAEFKQTVFLCLALLLIGSLIIGALIFKKIKKQKEALLIAHKKLEENNGKLSELNTVKNRLFSIIAHDLRNMLIPFQRSNKLLKYFIDNKQPEQAIQLSKELENNSYTLSNMLDNLLNWSLEQMNGYSYQATTISVKNEIEEIISIFNQQAIYKNTELKLQFKEDISFLFDKGAFNVIFRNLIGNALKYTENGKIKITFERDFNILKCSIADTGIGMTKEQINNVFSLEENKSTTGTQGEKGTGIGLNLVYRFVIMHKGNIKVTSEKRLGTEFLLEFPISEFKKEEQNESKPKSA